MQHSYFDARDQAREAILESLRGKPYDAQELLLRSRNSLKRLSGDLPIVLYEQMGRSPHHFATRSFAEAQAWGWLECASGVYQIALEHPGASMMHFKRCWRIWRPWCVQGTETERMEAIRERIRAGLWLSEAWARVTSERSRTTADAILRASLKETERATLADLVQETIAQQSLLPPPPLGSLASRPDGRTVPYLKTFML